MKKNSPGPVLLTIIVALLFFLPANSFARDRLASFDLEVNGGKRTDQLDWNIAGTIAGTSPNVLSELTWKDLEINEVSAKAKIVMVNNKVPFGGMVKGSIHYGEIQSGENQDSDYLTDNRTNEFSRSNNRSDWGEVWDSKVGGGLVFMSKNKIFSMAPLIGYSFHLQNLKIHDGYQTIYVPDPLLEGPISGLNSSYDGEWQTGFVGLDLEFKPSANFEVYGGVELHAGQYEAEANWNLRGDLRHPVSFTHQSDEATGVVTNVGLRVGLKNILLNAEMRYRKFQAEDGTAKTYKDDGTIPATRLNEVNWESISVGGGITVRF